ncbi:MAG: methylenetetrahydrofolate reductase [Lactobacillaceae bacterium]|jgi:methylenetetrahydrofolate reductase (NADPH)|nr:methylenetetrahydrofolate reductase [Lactobacillaceae bacterium]
MKINEIYQTKRAQKNPVISLEIFPPKKDGGIETLYEALASLGQISPDFVSVTYGAGGSGGVNETLDIAAYIKQEYGLESLHHLTGVLSNHETMNATLQAIQARGVENILALRGDVPADGDACISADYPLAKNLISDIHAFGGFSVGAACYPEGHIEALSNAENMQHMQAKEAAGADFFISQLFFDNASFYKLMDDARGARVNAPISAGIMPILNRSQVERMIFMCGASLPSKLIKLIHKYEHNPADLRAAGLDYAMGQIDDLITQGVDGVHIYTMNRPVVAQTLLGKYKKQYI